MNHKKLVVGNWKMNPDSLAEAKRIAAKVKRASPLLNGIDVVMCPPFPFLVGITPRKAVKNLSMGAQSASYENSGAHTGEVGARMLRNIGAEYVIVGHSEQRTKGDTDAIVARRVSAVLEAGLVPILCVGEAHHDEAGAYMDVLKEQIKGSLAAVPASMAKKIVIAYEPIWAIGVTEAMKPEDVYESSLFVKKVFADLFGAEAGLDVRVLYGGSVTFRNAPEIITVGKVDGFLVGRESVNAPGFIQLLKAVDAVS